MTAIPRIAPRPSILFRTSWKPALNLWPSALSVAAAIAVALLLGAVNQALGSQPQRAAYVSGALFAVVLVGPAAAYLLTRRATASAGTLAVIGLASIGVLLTGRYLSWAAPYVVFPADFLIWSESDFVNDIVKFRIGYPIYTAQANNESFTYAPGAQLLTYFLAWLSGNPTSIPVYRAFQVLYTAVAALVAWLACRRLLTLSTPLASRINFSLWSAGALPFFFLVATNPLTNPFTQNLHNDALGQLTAIVAFWLLLEYVASRDRRLLVAMAIVPVAGMLVKQSLAIWAVVSALHLGVFDRPRSWPRALAYSVLAFGALGLATAASYLIWGEHFVYWTIYVLGKRGVTPLRAVDHLLQVWPYLAMGLAGGLVLLRRHSLPNLLGPWLIWLAFFLLTVYTSSIAWMLNHIGPACLIASVWFFAALIRLSQGAFRPGQRLQPEVWVRTGAAVAAIGVLLGGLMVDRAPAEPLSPDAYRYKAEIEREFSGQPASTVLLDIGTWMYVEDGVVMKDRAPAIGERGLSQTGDFSGAVQRIGDRQYSKILVRNFNSPEFWYEHHTWSRPSNIKDALLGNYEEVRRIAAVTGMSRRLGLDYGLDEISVLVPRQRTAAAELTP
jgi:hypothetical protein